MASLSDGGLLMKIDWKAYFKEFCRQHSPDGKMVIFGADPETGKGGSLLFADGWRYSRDDPQGPEFPPPEEPEAHKKLIEKYWTIRLSTTQEEYRKAKNELIDMVRLQQRRNCSIYVASYVTAETDEGDVMFDQFGRERKRQVVERVDFDQMLDLVRQLKEDCSYCKIQLESVIIPTAEHRRFNPAEILARLNKIEKSPP